MQTKVKICGVTDPGDARLAAELGAWALGMIFWDASPRRCELDVAEEIGALLHRRVELAGVFVNAPLETVADVADRCKLTLVQLHGDEGPAYCREVARRTGARVIKAGRVRDAASLRRLEPFHTDFHLLDAYVPGRPGGTGKTFAWELVRAAPRGVARILSGGLTADNVAAGIEAIEPFAVDTASGTEARPGRKDPARLREFFAAVRATEPAEAEQSSAATTVEGSATP